jgi:2-polyprenyl-3-methyl-5-hydroxy-6-metoxy-1,4-benzoquinol methylase
MNLAQRSYQKELLDYDNIPFEDIKKNMKELNFINTWLGLQKLSVNKKTITVCEIGCGGGDNLVAIVNWCNKKNISVKCIGIDIKNECIEFAKQNELLNKNVEWICNDYKNVKFEIKPDIIFSSLFCHHFPESELTAQIQWMKENSTVGFFINDLERNIIAYHSIRLLTKLFSKSYLVKNDAPLSVARGLIKKEWQKIFETAKIKSFEIQWKWAFRYLIVSGNE